MRIVADENVRFLEEAFGDWGALDVYPAGKIGPEEVRDADILIVRSVTRVDEPLLEGGAVRHVASPTSGVDHVDIDYLADRGISFHHARGSNAYAVAQYVMSVLFAMESTGHLQISGSRIAVIGCGEVGSRVAKLAAVAGLEVLAIDPPRAERDSEFETQSYDALSQADIVTFHVPLTETGPHATRIWLTNRLSTV